MVGGPSITKPIERSKGFQYCLLSFHKDRAALDEYQASKEHHEYVPAVCFAIYSTDGLIRSVTSKLMWPFNEDLARFDFETEDEGIANGLALAAVSGAMTPPE